MPYATLITHHWYPGAMSVRDTTAPTASLDARGIGRMSVFNTSVASSPRMFLVATRFLSLLNITAPTASLVMKGVGRMSLLGKVNELSQDDVTGAVWEVEVEPGKSFRDAILELLAGGGGGGGGLTVSQDARLTRIEKILRNKLVTDPATGTMRLYDDDGTTLLLEADVFQDAAGTQPYQGQGAERRERLT
jgi:hypothetical protein